MFSVGSAIRVQKEKEKAETKQMTEFGKICNEAKIAANETRKVPYELPHGFTIHRVTLDNQYWTLLCNGNFVFCGSLDECFIAFGSHLQGVGK